MTEKTPEELEQLHRQLEMVRRTGACNMFDATCVRDVADSMDLHELAELIGGGRRHPDYSPLLFSHDPSAVELTHEDEVAIQETRDLYGI